MSEETKKTNFFKDFFKSIKDLDKYEDFAIELPKKAFIYLLKLIAIFCIIISIFYTYKIVENINNLYSNLKEKLPDFSYSQGNLQMNSKEPIVIEDYKDSIGRIIIDTNITESEVDKYKQEIDQKKIGVLILKDKCILLSNTAIGQVSYAYTDLVKSYDISEFTKQDVVNYVESMNIISIYVSIYFVMFVYLYIIYFISILMDVILLSILAWFVSRISRIRLKYAPSLSVAIHSITLPVLLNLIYIIVNLLTGFKIKYFQLMYSTISYIYVIVAILMIKTDFINRQMELIKLAQEKEKIKKEMEEKEDKEKPEEKNKKPKEEEKPEVKEKSKKRKKQDGGNDENGVGADAPACEEIPKE